MRQQPRYLPDLPAVVSARVTPSQLAQIATARGERTESEWLAGVIADALGGGEAASQEAPAPQATGNAAYEAEAWSRIGRAVHAALADPRARPWELACRGIACRELLDLTSGTHEDLLAAADSLWQLYGWHG